MQTLFFRSCKQSNPSLLNLQLKLQAFSLVSFFLFLWDFGCLILNLDSAENVSGKHCWRWNHEFLYNHLEVSQKRRLSGSARWGKVLLPEHFSYNGFLATFISIISKDFIFFGVVGASMDKICRRFSYRSPGMLWSSQRVKWYLGWRVCAFGKWFHTLWSWCYCVCCGAFFCGMDCCCSLSIVELTLYICAWWISIVLHFRRFLSGLFADWPFEFR